MNIVQFWAIAGAVMVGNAFSLAFFMGMMKASRLQKDGAKDDELPWWVYVCLIIPLLFLLAVMLKLEI